VRDLISTIVELAGLLAVVVAAFLWDFRLGLLVLGLVLILVGYVVGRPSPPREGGS
jgi:hypothetical protein